MLLCEMVRKIGEENRLIHDTTQRGTNQTTYTTVASYNITLEKRCILLYYYDIGGAVVYPYARLKIGPLCIGGERGPNIGASTYLKKYGFFALDAGSYTVELQLRSESSSYTVYVREFILGVISFSDISSIVLQSAGQSTIMLASRKTCVGTTKRAALIIQAYSSSGAPTVTVDGNQLSAAASDNEKYVYSTSVTLDSSHTVNVSTGCYSAIMSPWLLPASDSEFISLCFPQGSTLYIVTEPLWDNPTKNIRIGKIRVISFGASTDYYSSASGTGILTFNYTFESLRVEDITLYVSGLGGCISIIGVDVRT